MAANEGFRLKKGYDLARAQGRRPLQPRLRACPCHSAYTPKDPEEKYKQRIAQESWSWHFSNADMIDFPFMTPDAEDP